MRKFIIASLLLSSHALAGGIIGGNPGLALELSETAFSLQSLPKSYANQEDLRRASVRLSEAGVEAVELKVDGEKIKVRKLHDSIVDEKISKEVLPVQ